MPHSDLLPAVQSTKRRDHRHETHLISCIIAFIITTFSSFLITYALGMQMPVSLIDATSLHMLALMPYDSFSIVTLHRRHERAAMSIPVLRKMQLFKKRIAHQAKIRCPCRLRTIVLPLSRFFFTILAWIFQPAVYCANWLLNSCVYAPFFANSCACVPCSMILPCSITKI